MQLPVMFLHPWAWSLAVGVIPLLWLRRRRQPAVGHSSVSMHQNLRAIPLVGRLPSILFTVSVLLLVGAIARPVLPTSHESKTIETRDMLVAVDISSSMGSALPQNGQTSSDSPPSTAASGDGNRQAPRRLDAARDAVVTFVQARPKDRIGLLEFDDQAYWHWPLSDDHKIIERKARILNAYLGGGTNFEGPTERNPRMGPIQAAINHFRKYGKAKSKILIMVTDGEDSINPQRADQLVEEMQAEGVRLYVLGVGDSWTNGSTPDLQSLAERMNGKVFRVGDAGAMQAAFDQINQLEVSRVQLERSVTYRDVFPLFVGASVILLVLFLGSVAITREDA